MGIQIKRPNINDDLHEETDLQDEIESREINSPSKVTKEEPDHPEVRPGEKYDILITLIEISLSGSKVGIPRI